ncbi:hypothetical protein DNH61_23545 [Paenibacillus sambharensis]|uniref:Uncharacterized protein n=1 Tax=Paenibacillus sambharensis TaxID=1803190 RepID=A0A2W1LEX7_9BACL|nr:hypothetical protein [Paenibacillus sambharensis]PZD93595.1 hypothetical protein DNH61_23545 [Paenibacillus sambharensis]
MSAVIRSMTRNGHNIQKERQEFSQMIGYGWQYLLFPPINAASVCIAQKNLHALTAHRFNGDKFYVEYR